MDNYVSNSHKSRERSKEDNQETIPEKKVEKVVSGNVKTKKKSEARKFMDIFLPDDVSNVKSFILMDVMIPAAKKVIMDAVEVFLYDGISGNRGSNGRRGSSAASRIQYNSIYDSKSSNTRKGSTGRANVYDYNEVILDNRGEAEDVLACMDELIAKYGMISVADYYDLVGINGTHTDNKYGWTDIRSAKTERNRDGSYSIVLPRAVAL